MNAEQILRKVTAAAERAQERAVEANYGILKPDEADANADKAEHAAEEAEKIATRAKNLASDKGEEAERWAAEADDAAKQAAEAAQAGNATAARQHCTDAKHAMRQVELIADRNASNQKTRSPPGPPAGTPKNTQKI